MLILTTSVSKSLKRSSSASYEGNCVEQTLLKAYGTKARTTFFLPRKSARCQSSLFPVLRVKSGATSPTFNVFDSERVLTAIKNISFLKNYLVLPVVHSNTCGCYWLC